MAERPIDQADLRRRPIPRRRSLCGRRCRRKSPGEPRPSRHVLEAAADVDSEAAELLALSESQSRYGAAAFVGFLASIGGLRPGLSEEEATDICWVHLSFTAYRRLVVTRGWSPDRFERWLARSVTLNLTRPEVRARSAAAQTSSSRQRTAADLP